MARNGQAGQICTPTQHWHLQGNIASWNKKEGEEIAAGDSIAEIETDKATMDWEAQDEGFLAKIILGEGTKDIAVGTPVAIVVEEEEHVSPPPPPA